MPERISVWIKAYLSNTWKPLSITTNLKKLENPLGFFVCFNKWYKPFDFFTKMFLCRHIHFFIVVLVDSLKAEAGRQILLHEEIYNYSGIWSEVKLKHIFKEKLKFKKWSHSLFYLLKVFITEWEWFIALFLHCFSRKLD